MGTAMQEGYIKLHRCILDSGWARHPDYMAVWVYCLLRGNYKPADVVTKWGGVVKLEAGQFITSREQISLNTGVQESKVERILKHFKNEQQIEQQNRGKFRIISILNWRKYQVSEQENEQQVNNTRTTGEQQVNTDKKVKKEKKKKEERAVADLLPICKAWKAYIEMRQCSKIKFTDHAKELAAQQIMKLVAQGQDPVAVLEQSVFKTWQGLFPVKQEANQPGKKEEGQSEARLRELGLIE